MTSWEGGGVGDTNGRIQQNINSIKTKPNVITVVIFVCECRLLFFTYDISPAFPLAFREDSEFRALPFVRAASHPGLVLKLARAPPRTGLCRPPQCTPATHQQIKIISVKIDNLNF